MPSVRSYASNRCLGLWMRPITGRPSRPERANCCISGTATRATLRASGSRSHPLGGASSAAPLTMYVAKRRALVVRRAGRPRNVHREVTMYRVPLCAHPRINRARQATSRMTSCSVTRTASTCHATTRRWTRKRNSDIYIASAWTISLGARATRHPSSSSKPTDRIVGLCRSTHGAAQGLPASAACSTGAPTTCVNASSHGLAQREGRPSRQSATLRAASRVARIVLRCSASPPAGRRSRRN